METEKFKRNLYFMTKLFEPIILKELIDNLQASLCDVCFKLPRNKKLTQCVFCKIFFCNSCCGKQGTQICYKCNYLLATHMNENILKEFSISEMLVICRNYNIPRDNILEKENLIEAILLNFKISIKPKNETVQVSELKKKMDELQVEETLQKEKIRMEDENRSKKFGDYSQITNENINLRVKFSPGDSIDFSEEEISKLPNRKLKDLLDRFNINYSGFIEKKELVLSAISLRREFEKFKNSHKNDVETRLTKNLNCNLCKVKVIDCAFLFCGHAMCCFKCGSKLSNCPNCSADIKQCFNIIIG